MLDDARDQGCNTHFKVFAEDGGKSPLDMEKDRQNIKGEAVVADVGKLV